MKKLWQKLRKGRLNCFIFAAVFGERFLKGYPVCMGYLERIWNLKKSLKKICKFKIKVFIFAAAKTAKVI
ncbi:hypothetical protein DLK05_15670 [Ancylomarina longa]|uniref:Uncharacterized protein n=1 Tax=Ancylomarina longa TaxID=2487017 RepID=A0A434AF67_9BACT|nr:hypothetical protein DLK05_15670 [Ancylomarina longa]